MRRYTLTVNGTQKVVDVEAVGADLFRVQLDGRLIDVSLEDHRDLAHSAITPAVTPRHKLAPAARTASGTPAAAPAAATPSAPAAPGGAKGAGRDKMTAPMPGVILTVDVAPGAAVTRGQSLMVLEAMKMKNELKAPRDAVVAEIYVAAGQQVKFGETLVRFEA
ncbi:MAG: acetyl-CoA carboxylase biotin carboxyl carrier protein subunit [Nigerium sp.]|nr:acetyl-CoA carboxylase biotin carboxyl carrier protein subunit [Nigerium sp.]